jgi:hypothetical protein
MQEGIEMHQGQNSFRGYELLNAPFTHASVALMDRLEVSQLLAMGEGVDLQNGKGKAEESRYLNAALDWLFIHGYVDFVEGKEKLRPTAKGKGIFEYAALITRSVTTYSKIKNAMKWDVGLMNGKRGELNDLTYGYWRKEPLIEAMVPVATAYSGLAPARNGVTIAKSLLEKGSVSDGDVFDPDISNRNFKNRSGFMQVLLEAEVVAPSGDRNHYLITQKGRKLLELNGYAQLVVSYYDMLEKLYSLHTGEDSYGMNGTVNRDAEINAHASNGILSVRVAPYLVGALQENPLLKETVNGNAAFLDYGSGGADMLMQAAARGPASLRHFYGIDINPKTVSEASKILEENGMADRVSLVTGSITDKESLEAVSRKMKKDGLAKGVATINFILHDIGHDKSADFLRYHAQVFGNMPLMITETLRMPLDVCRANPNYQAPSFQFMHDASGQQLFEEWQLRKLLGDSGYEIVTEKTHSSMPDATGSKKMPTIITWMVRYKG